MKDPLLFVTHVVSDFMLTDATDIEQLQRSTRARMINELFFDLPMDVEKVAVQFYPPEQDKRMFTTRYFASADLNKIQDLERRVEFLEAQIRFMELERRMPKGD